MLGMNDEVPPAVPGAFEEFATRLAGDELHRLITTAEPVTDPNRFRIGPSVRRRYERCARLPEGFVALGDSLCCFNPAYGQGMTTAAMTAIWLRTCLESGVDGLTSRYFKGVTTIVDVPWAITVGNDLRFPEWPARARGASRSSRVHAPPAPRRDDRHVVGETFLKVANFLVPPQKLISPRVLWRVWRGRAGKPTATIGQHRRNGSAKPNTDTASPDQH